MNNTKDAAYCRLCAELKQHDKLTNLQTDQETCQKVVDKLSRFNIVMDFQEKILPKTVCLICVKSLERAFAFVTAVEQAQAFLNNFILEQLNTSESDSCDENIFYEPPDDQKGIVEFKDENSHDSIEGNDDGTNLNEESDSQVMTDLYNDYSVINSNTEKQEIENKTCRGTVTGGQTGLQTSKDIIVENPDIIKDECNKLPDIYKVKDNKYIEKDCKQYKRKSELIPLGNKVCSAEYINIHSNSNVGIKNMGKSIQQLQPTLNSEQIPPKLLATTQYSETYLDKTKSNKQKNSNKATKSADADVEHIQMSWKDYEWKCSHCGTFFPEIEELQEHSMQYHNSCNPYQCTECVIKRSNLNMFMQHVRQHRNYLFHSCYKCFKKFPKPYQTGYHKRKVHEDSKYVCSGCNTPFYSNEELKDHVKKYYYKFPQNTSHIDLTCTICNKVTPNARDLRKHILTHPKKKVCVCETCGKCFWNKHQLEEHVIARHNAVKILHHCNICNASFIRASKLQNHKSIHTGIKSFTCDICGKSFRTKHNIIQHLATHTESLPYTCRVCLKKFRWSFHLKHHMLQHTGEKPYSCDICVRDFADICNRNKHMRRRHGIEMARKKQPVIKLRMYKIANSTCQDVKTSPDLAGCHSEATKAT